jgi:hypothetical protein
LTLTRCSPASRLALTLGVDPPQVLTHLKEKLQFVQAENQVLKHDLADLEIELTNKRDVRAPDPA